MSKTTKTEIVNGAIYAKKSIALKNYFPICDACINNKICCEPDKERRLTCTDKTYFGVKKKIISKETNE